MIFPEKITDINSGRLSKEEYIKRNFNEFYEFLNKKYSEFYITFAEKLYWFYNNISVHPVCKTCGKPTRFISNSYGYTEHCCAKCTQSDKAVRDKNKATSERINGPNYKKKIYEKVCRTKQEKYGNKNYNNSEKAKQTCIEKYGADNPLKVESIKKKVKNTCLLKYGSNSYLESEKFSSERKQHLEKSKYTSLKKYGVYYPMQSDSVKSKVRESCIEKYGVDWNCMRKEAHNSKNYKSNANEEFSRILDSKNIIYEREKTVSGYVYDFCVSNILIEINPSATHNINWNPFSKSVKIDKNYHLAKTKTAEAAGYRCIHIWDWENPEIVADMIGDKTSVFARECIISAVPKKDTDKFLIDNHLQGTVKRQTVRIGLYYNGELVQIMTFGKPRYNNNFEFELLRLCTKRGIKVIGGAEKIMKYFDSVYKNPSIISYCDISKFDGSVYKRLGFIVKRISRPACHWINLRTKQRITAAELRRLGADNLINTSYGKGVSNEAILLKKRWVQVFDCGQKTYIRK